MEVIKSKDNKLIKDIKRLKERRYRTSSNKFIVEGFRFVREALASSFNVPYVLLSENKKDKFLLEENLKFGTKFFLVSDEILKSICSTDTPQGIVAIVENKKVHVDDLEGFYILVDKVQDPGNMGTIIRTANAAGAKGVIITKGSVDIYNDKTLRATMGSIFKIPIIIDEDLIVLRSLKAKGFKLVVSSLDTNNNFYDVNLKEKIIIAVGNEGNGISEEIFSLQDIKIKIPMPGDAESLNVGIAAAIMMYEAVRQRNS